MEVLSNELKRLAAARARVEKASPSGVLESKKLPAEKATSQMVDPSKEPKKLVIEICIMLSFGVMFMLLSFLIPGISKPQQILLWQVAILSFLVGAGFIGLYLKFFYWSSERKIKKA
uniref:Endoplasmic reticulum transmembrane protein n=1 Tax=Oryza glumipatula TaxID=40148 RepID=A0A0E0B669_9ORYZ